MIDMLKNLAMKKLGEKMLGNSLSPEATNEAASEGANALLESLKGGDIGQLTALLGGAGGAAGSNGVMENIQGKLSQILQSKGMSAEDAEAEAAQTAPDLINGLKEKFLSTDEADSEFNLEGLTDLIPGNAGDLLNKVKGFL